MKISVTRQFRGTQKVRSSRPPRNTTRVQGRTEAKASDRARRRFVQLDACSDDESLLVEAYARQGKLKGAQIKKISQDILRLALLKRDPRLSDSRAIAVFASEEARDSIAGWIRSAAEEFEIELIVVDIPDDLRDEIKAAQARQVMVNVELPVEDVADDVTLEKP